VPELLIVALASLGGVLAATGAQYASVRRRGRSLTGRLGLWTRAFRCGKCHGTGVIMTGERDCGGSPYSSHEQYCGTYPCPNDCAMARDRDAAWARWRYHVPGAPRYGLLLRLRLARLEGRR
jgi:hypothetical protein